MPVDGGEEVLILDQPMMSTNWTVVEDGIYFIRFEVNTRRDGMLFFFDFLTSRVKEVVKLGKGHIVQGGLAASVDRRSFLYSVWEHQRGDIMLVENFR